MAPRLTITTPKGADALLEEARAAAHREYADNMAEGRILNKAVTHASGKDKKLRRRRKHRNDGWD